jgi:hypothetical protein
MKRNRFTVEQNIRMLREGLRFACRRQERDENNREPRTTADLNQRPLNPECKENHNQNISLPLGLANIFFFLTISVHFEESGVTNSCRSKKEFIVYCSECPLVPTNRIL